ncbi:hypothetical protein [Collimonas sp. OK307]|uniref:hypothetical protein n=1 Tax=Collimonas sp. OK307 TaxID=1801620 RepID=UPI000B89AD2A|nr:hypothetical protein [Collimonas sp. OK307]
MGEDDYIHLDFHQDDAMKHHFIFFAAAMFFVPLASIAATGSHDFSNGFKTCLAAANTSEKSKSACLSDELNLQSKAVVALHQSISQSLAGAKKQQLADDFVEWKKTILLDCSIQADNKTVPIERENTRKYCLIERTIGRMDAYELLRQDQSPGR